MPNLKRIWRTLGIWVGCESAAVYQISHQQGQSKKPIKTRRKQKSTGIRTDDMLHFNNCTLLAWE